MNGSGVLLFRKQFTKLGIIITVTLTCMPCRFGGGDGSSHGTGFEPPKYSPSFTCPPPYDCSQQPQQGSQTLDSLQEPSAIVTLIPSHTNSILHHPVVAANNQCNNLQYSSVKQQQQQHQQPTSLSEPPPPPPSYPQQTAAGPSLPDMSVTSSTSAAAVAAVASDKKQDSFKPAPPAAPLGATSTTIEYKPKYNRRNNPDLEKRRIHFCDHLGKQPHVYYLSNKASLSSLFWDDVYK